MKAILICPEEFVGFSGNRLVGIVLRHRMVCGIQAGMNAMGGIEAAFENRRSFSASKDSFCAYA